MVCKEDVYLWFSKLCAPKRLDFMCGFLPMFHPLELRFIGSCLEDLAKKDYNSLRENENKANDPAEVRKYVDLFDVETRSKISVHLSLLHSSNTACSNILFNALMCIPPLLQQASFPNLPIDSNLINDIILMLTMAAYHPSFTFHQRQILFEHLRAVQALFEEQSSKDSCLPAASDSCHHTDHIGVRSPSVNGSKDHKSSSSNSSNSSSGQNATNSPVYVESVEVTGCQVRPSDKKSEFIIQVTWSDGQVTETCRTYQQLHYFHSELIKLFPKDSGAHKQKRQIPFLPQEKGPSHDHSELEEHIGKYLRQLSMLQDHILQCDHVTAFFRSSTAGSTATSASVVPAKTTTPTPSPLTITVESRRPLIGGQMSDRSIPTAIAGNSSTSNYSCHTYSMVQTSPSPLSSPLPSPLSSPYVSPSTSNSSRPSSPGLRCGITLWLKNMRLHKYTERLSKYSIEEFVALADKDLQAEGLTEGARRKFLNNIEQFKEMVSSSLNGMVSTDSGVRSSSPSTWHTSPTATPYLPAQSQVASSKGSLFNMSSSDSSPACSEYSSPPNSPVPDLKHRHSSASSEDDKDLQDPSDTGTGDSSEGLLPTPNMTPLPNHSTVNEHIPIASRLNSGLMGVPPCVKIENQVMNTFIPIHNPVDIKGAPEVMPPHHYQAGVRSMLPPGMIDMTVPQMYFPQRIRSPRQQALQQNVQLKPVPLAPSTTATTSPIMPSPKMPANTATVIYENGHQVAPAQPYPLVPNHNGQQVTHPHVHHVGVPPGHPPPKACSQYSLTEVPSSSPGMTPSTPMTATTETVMTFNGPVGYGHPTLISNQGGPVNTVGGCMARPNSLNTLASTSLTYSVAPGHHMHKAQAPLDSKGNPMSQQPPHHQQVPLPPSIPSHCVVSSHEFPSYQSMSGCQGTSTVTYTSPPPTPVLHMNSPTPTPGHSPAPPQQTQTVPPNSTSSCSSCGCLGNCINATPTAPTNPPPPPYPYGNYPMWHWPQTMFQGSAVPFIPGNSNGLISPNVPFPPMHPPMANGLSTDILYSNHPNFLIQAAGAGPAHAHNTSPYMAFSGSVHQSLNHANSSNTGKKATCHNCGRSGHRGPECKEATMEALTHSGAYHLKLRPTSQDIE